MLDANHLEIRELGPEEKITEPGFYAISLDRHHNQPCDGISVTSGTLRKMLTHTPGDVWAFHILNEHRYEQKETTALRLGRAMAAWVEGGPEALEDVCRVLPADKPRKPTEAQLNAYKEGRATEKALESIQFWADVDRDPRDPISETEFELLVAMGKSLAADPAASAALGGNPEITMAWYDDLNDLWCLARPDQTSFDGMLSDYKKISTQGAALTANLVDRKITNYRYDIQMGFAAEAFEVLTHNWPSAVGLVFQSDAAPYFPMLREISEQDLRIGMFEAQKARRMFRECLDSGIWRTPGDDIGTYRRPDWMMEKILNEMQEAGIAA